MNGEANARSGSPTSHPRGRSIVFGLAAVLGACTAAAPGQPHEDYLPPVREDPADGLRIVNHGAAERLHLFVPDTRQGMTLLFLGGRAATITEDGGSLWHDTEAGRILSLDARGRVRAVLTDSSGAGSVLASTRSVFDIQLQPLDPAEPLLWLSDASGVRGVGRVRAADQAILGPVVNAGWLATSKDGSTVYAAAVRPEIHRYDRSGELLWVSTWKHDGLTEPTLGVEGGALVPRFRLIQQAVAIGPDERVYVLATSGAEGPANRLLVFERDGTLLREGSVDGDAAVYVRRSGHVFTLPREEAMTRTVGPLARVAFEPFDLPSLVDSSRVRLADHRGKVAVVNFWASWCGPCRREMPLLDGLARELDPEEAVVVGVNDDVGAADALGFLEELGGVGYPNAFGAGRMRERYGYRGLPYTVVLDREGRLHRVLYGFGQSIEPVREAVRDALLDD